MDTQRQAAGTAVATREWPSPRLTERISGLAQPVAISSAGDGSGRLFVCEKPGRVRVIADGALAPEPFLDITDRVGERHTEQGLLGVAFPPGFLGDGGHFYVCYTAPDNTLIVSRFFLDGEVGDPDSEEVVLPLWQPYRNHNGGQIAFGPDGLLYVGVGDGGSEYDPSLYGQNPGVALAKILRIDPETAGRMHTEGGECDCPYHVPEDNPFVANPYFVQETWHWGLRNPWRFSFDRATGDMYIGDVGQDDWEEIDFAPAGVGGLNFGWSLREGRHAHAPAGRPAHEPGAAGEDDLVDPVAEYDHAEDGGIAVIGGYVYRGQAYESLAGVYLFADFGNGRLYGLRRGPDGAWESRELASTGRPITSFGEAEDGELFVTDYNGAVSQVEA